VVTVVLLLLKVIVSVNGIWKYSIEVAKFLLLYPRSILPRPDSIGGEGRREKGVGCGKMGDGTGEYPHAPESLHAYFLLRLDSFFFLVQPRR
jgi:hypothetical protein